MRADRHIGSNASLGRSTDTAWSAGSRDPTACGVRPAVCLELHLTSDGVASANVLRLAKLADRWPIGHSD